MAESITDTVNRARSAARRMHELFSNSDDAKLFDECANLIEQLELKSTQETERAKSLEWQINHVRSML